jgi:hypothetical protein
MQNLQMMLCQSLLVVRRDLVLGLGLALHHEIARLGAALPPPPQVRREALRLANALGQALEPRQFLAHALRERARLAQALLDQRRLARHQFRSLGQGR